MADQLIKHVDKRELMSLPQQDLVQKYLDLYERLTTSNLKLGLSRITIADQAKSITAQSKALRRAMKQVRSLRHTVKRRRRKLPWVK
jgi:hypothetical protein